MYSFLKQASWKLIAELTYDELQQIYELTYKYGWILSEERQQGLPQYPSLANLPDRAYLEKLKIEDRLRPWIEYGLEELAETYEWWLEQHKEDGWIYSLIELWESDGLDAVRFNFFHWRMSYQPYVYQFIAEKLGGDRGLLAAQGEEYVIESFGGDYLDEQFWPKLAGEDLDQAHTLWASVEEESGEFEANKRIIDTYGLYDSLLDWAISGVGWTAVEYLEDVYGLNDLLSTYAGLLVENDEEFLQLMYKVYLDSFSGLDQRIINIERGFEDITKAQVEGSSLEDRILAFQYGLTTAHHTGTMADYLLQVSQGEGQKILDQISSGPEKEKWDRELEKILGHPLE